MLAARDIALVYGGASIGLMGVLADEVLRSNGDAIGVVPRHLVEYEVPHAGLSDLRIVDSMHERKAVMSDLADAFVALPGGMGTLEELLETATWAQLGLHGKPCALLDVRGYFAGLIELLDHALAEGFLAREHRDILLVDDDPAGLLNRLAMWRAPRSASTPPLGAR